MRRSLSSASDADGHRDGDAAPTANAPAYKAFLSYSHAVDGRLAPALQHGLHRFARPWYRVRAVRVFRDQTSLAATPSLWSAIENALSQSEYLIVLASPDAARSQWVSREAEYWLAHKSPETILLVVTDGEVSWDDAEGDFDWSWTTALPTSLRRVFREEPFYVDLRWARSEENLSLRDPRFRGCLADLAAPLHGRSKDELIDEDVRQHRRTSRLARAAVATVMAFALIAGVLARVALNERGKAEEQARLATSRQLAAQAAASFDEDLDRGLLLAIESYRVAPTQQALDSLLRGTLREPRLQRYLHAGRSVAGLAFSPDGRTLASGSALDDGGSTVRLWDLTADHPVGRALSGHTDTVWSVAFSPDGRTLASGGADKTVRVWDLTAENPVGAVLTGHTETVWSVAFAADGRTVASGSADKTVRLWDLDSGPEGTVLAGHDGSVRTVAFSSRGVVASGGADRAVRLWEAATGRPLDPPLEGHGDGIEDLEFDSAGDTLASGARDRTVRVWDVATRRLVTGPLTGHRGDVNDVAFSADGRMLASGSSDQDVRLWQVPGGEPVGQPLHANDFNVQALAFSPDSRTLAVGDAGGEIVLWQPTGEASPLGPRTLVHGATVSGLSFSPDGTLVASAGGAAHVWDVRNGQDRRTLVPGGGADVGDLAFGPDSRTVVGGTSDGHVVVWDVPTGRARARTPGHSGTVNTVAVSRGGVVASSGGDGRIVLWDLPTLRKSAELASGSAVTHLAFSPDGTKLASTGIDLVIWDVAGAGQEYRRSSEPVAPGTSERVVRSGFGIRAAAFPPDGRSVAVDGASPDQVVFWDVAGHRAAGEPFTRHTGQVSDLAFDAGGRILASASYDGTAILWDLGSGQPLGQPLAPVNAGAQPGLLTVAVSRDGTLVAAGGLDGRITIWDIGFDNLRERACLIANRNLTASEWRRFTGQPRSVAQCPGAG